MRPLISIYSQTSAFMLSINEGSELWDILFSNPFCLIGFILFITGITNIFTNVESLMPSIIERKPWLSWLFALSSFVSLSGVAQLVFEHFALLNTLFYFLAAIVTGVVAFLCCIILAKLLPNH